jgi:predicted nucleic acid-binding Zn ribbon protein
MGLKKRKKEGEEGSASAVKIPQHKHCHTCGKAIPPGEQYCSESCEAEFQKAVKSRKMLVYVIYAMVALMMAALATSLI